MRLSKTGAACAAIVGVMLAVGSADAQEKRVRINLGGAYPSTTAILGTGQQYFVDTVRKISGGSIDCNSSSRARWCPRASISTPSPAARSSRPGP